MIIMVWQLLFTKIDSVSFKTEFAKPCRIMCIQHTHILLKIGYFTLLGSSENLSLNFV